MRKLTLFGIALIIIVMAVGVSYAENDLPLSDRIKILKITPYGEKTKDIFEIRTDDFSYENFFKLIQERIKNGYKLDCNCDFDNEFLLSLKNRSVFRANESESVPIIYFKRIHKLAGDEILDIDFKCRIFLSENMKFAGLLFQQYISGGDPFAQHFVMMNSKGEKVWEMPNSPVEVLIEPKGAMTEFPDNKNRKFGTNYVISGDGKALLVKGIIYMGNKGWTFYDNGGNILKDSPRTCYKPVFSSEGNLLLIQENDDPNPHPHHDYSSGTSCYDTQGNLLWRKENIAPVTNIGYFISPTGKYFLAGIRISDNTLDLGLFDYQGKLVSKANRPQQDINTYHMPDYQIRVTDEAKIIWRTAILNRSWEPVLDCTKIMKSDKIKIKLGKLIFDQVFPFGANCFVATGFRMSDLKRNFSPVGSTKFIGIIDSEFELEGFKSIHTEKLSDKTIRLYVDNKSGRVYFHTNEIVIEAQIMDLEK